MKQSLLAIPIVAFVIGFLAEGSSTFTDNGRKYKIVVPDSIHIKGESFGWNTAVSDTAYLEVSVHGHKVLWADFLEADEYTKDLTTSVIENGHTECAADGEDGWIDCKNIDSSRVQKTRHGVVFAEFYLMKLTHFRGKDSNFVVGPYYAVDISNPAAKRILFLPARTSEVSIDERTVAHLIVDGIRLLK